MTIPASDRVRRFRERGCGSACQGDSPRYALLSLMYAARVYANLHRREVGYQSSLKEGIRANNAEQQWVFHGLNCVQYRRYSLSSVSLVFTAQCFRMLQQRISFLLAAAAMSLFTNLLEITFVFSLPFCSFPSFSPRFLSLCARALSLVIFRFSYRVIKFVQTRIASETRKIKFLHSRRENLICLCDRREVGVEKTIVCVVRPRLYNFCGPEELSLGKDYSCIFACFFSIKTLGEREREKERGKRNCLGKCRSNCEVPIHKSDKIRKWCSFTRARVLKEHAVRSRNRYYHLPRFAINVITGLHRKARQTPRWSNFQYSKHYTFRSDYRVA